LNCPQDIILERVVNDLLGRYSDNIISIYGIGSYFDERLPPEWVKNDIDIIVFVKSVSKPYKKRQIERNQVWIGFYTIESFQDKEKFMEISKFANYEWSVLELKHPENSKLLYGEDIRGKLPDTSTLLFDYDDILARGLYHIDKSLKEKNSIIDRREFSKGIFKIGFYFCILFDPLYRKTSLVEIGAMLKTLETRHEIIREMSRFYEEALIFRVTQEFKSDFRHLRKDFVIYILKLLKEGTLHRTMAYSDTAAYLTNTYNGFLEIFKILKHSQIYTKEQQ
jgi:hypothetical protein